VEDEDLAEKEGHHVLHVAVGDEERVAFHRLDGDGSAEVLDVRDILQRPDAPELPRPHRVPPSRTGVPA
jgi:hypothetical protein